MNSDRHIPVLLKEVLSHLPTQTHIFVDGTLGDGGHTQEVIKRVPGLQAIFACDRDPDALDRAYERIPHTNVAMHLFATSYEFLAERIREYDVRSVDAILLDLGLSSPQLVSGRGFSFNEKGPLDMRFDPTQKLTAADVLNTWDVLELTDMLRVFGEEKFAYHLAQAIAQQRKRIKYVTCDQLVETILAVYRQKMHSTKDVPWTKGLHPATKTFQALRIAVNDELGALERALPKLIELLRSGGRLLVITFHSGEERIVKACIARESRACVCPPEQPMCTCGHVKTIRRITKKPIGPSKEELNENPRSRSAHLRIIEKI